MWACAVLDSRTQASLFGHKGQDFLVEADSRETPRRESGAEVTVDGTQDCTTPVTARYHVFHCNRIININHPKMHKFLFVSDNNNIRTKLHSHCARRVIASLGYDTVVVVSFDEHLL